jgi:urease accessory protein
MTGMLELLLADARTPSGGYAHSGGLEAAVEQGLGPWEVPGFIRARLHTVARCEATLAALAAAASSDELLILDLEFAARTPAEPLRRASRLLGRGLLRTAVTWWPEQQLLSSYRTSSTLTPRPVVLGVIAQIAGLSQVSAARLSLYDDVATVAGAAVKLLPLDAAVTTGWLASLAVELDRVALQAASDALAGEAPSTATPLLDRRALIHSANQRRLFVS